MEKVIFILIVLTAVLKSLKLLMNFKEYLKHCYRIVLLERRQKVKTLRLQRQIKEK